MQRRIATSTLTLGARLGRIARHSSTLIRPTSSLAASTPRVMSRSALRPIAVRPLSTTAGSVNAISDEKTFTDLTSEDNSGNLTIVYWTASWCGPCKQIKPIYTKLCEENPGAKFLQVDVDEMDQLAAANKVNAMPTFHFWRNGDKIDQLVGADPHALANIVVRLTQ